MKKILGVLFLMGCFLGVIYFTGPLFIADARGSGWRPAPELRAEPGGRCTTHSFVVTDCRVGWKSIAGDEKGRISYILLGPTGSVPLRFLRAADGHVTLAWGLDHMMWRGVTLVFWIVAAAATIAFAALGAKASEADPMEQRPERAPPAPEPRSPISAAPRPAGFGRR